MEKTLGEHIREIYMENLILKDEVRKLKAELEDVEREYIRAIVWGVHPAVWGGHTQFSVEKCMEILEVYEDKYLLE